MVSVENHDRYAGDKAWNFYENDEIKGQFKEEDMRLGVVWRELCLDNHQVRILYVPRSRSFQDRESTIRDDMMPLEINLVETLASENYKDSMKPIRIGSTKEKV